MRHGIAERLGKLSPFGIRCGQIDNVDFEIARRQLSREGCQGSEHDIDRLSFLTGNDEHVSPCLWCQLDEDRIVERNRFSQPALQRACNLCWPKFAEWLAGAERGGFMPFEDARGIAVPATPGDLSG